MSCIRFNTTAQREAMRRAADAPVSSEDAAALHLAPPVTESKLARLRLLATHESPGIRQAAASSRHAPDDLLAQLAADPDPTVRAVVARNETTPCDVLMSLAHDPDPQVRCWLAVNFFAPAEAMAALAHDEDPQVRRLVGWKTGLAV